MTPSKTIRANETGDLDDIAPEDLERALPDWAVKVNKDEELLVTRSLMLVLAHSKTP